MKILYLLRHAKAQSAQGDEEDISRQLAPQGREHCAVIGAYMKQKHYKPDFVLCSSAQRTKETFSLVTQSLGITPPHIFERKIYVSSTDTLLSLIHSIDDKNASSMLVGHNPTIHQLAFSLSNPEPIELYQNLKIKYPPGALTVLHFALDSWRDIGMGQGKLADFFINSNAH